MPVAPAGGSLKVTLQLAFNVAALLARGKHVYADGFAMLGDDALSEDRYDKRRRSRAAALALTVRQQVACSLQLPGDIDV
jgi:hypothetical protein